MSEPPENHAPDHVETETPPVRPVVNTPFVAPPRGRARIVSEEPPPLPPGFISRCLTAISVWAHQPQRLPFWWHLSTRALEIAHWNRSFDQFQTSSLEFYERLDKTLGDQFIPRLALSRILWKESGLFSAERLYFRVKWNRFVGDVCAAPFGRAFFFSFWVFYLPRVISLCHIAGISAISFAVALDLAFAAGSDPTPILLFGWFPSPLLLLFWLRYSRQAVNDDALSDFILGLTVLGPFIDVWFRPYTYFERDTAAMFTGMIERSFFEEVEAVTKERAELKLTQEEKKPEMAEFMSVKRMGRPR